MVLPAQNRDLRVVHIPVTSIDPPPFRLRENLGDLSELVDNIRTQGLLNPLMVRPKGRRFEVVHGHRRLEALKALGRTTIPCTIIQLDDRQAFEAALSENIHRQTMTPIEEARAFKRYLDEGWGDVETLARQIGKTPRHIYDRLSLLRLKPELQQKIQFRPSPQPRAIPVSHAEEIAKLPEEKQEEVAKVVLEKRLGRDETASLVRHVKRGATVEESLERVEEEEPDIIYEEECPVCGSPLEVVTQDGRPRLRPRK